MIYTPNKLGFMDLDITFIVDFFLDEDDNI